jgi:hypothetical protein
LARTRRAHSSSGTAGPPASPGGTN